MYCSREVDVEVDDGGGSMAAGAMMVGGKEGQGALRLTDRLPKGRIVGYSHLGAARSLHSLQATHEVGSHFGSKLTFSLLTNSS